jgi:restriction system protein
MGTKVFTIDTDAEVFDDDLPEIIEKEVRTAVDRACGRGAHDKVMNGNGRALPINKKEIKSQKQSVAEQVNDQVEEVWEDLRGLLQTAQTESNSVPWEQIKEEAVANLDIPQKPTKPDQETEPRRPVKKNFVPAMTLIDHLLPWRKQEKREEARSSFRAARQRWNERRRNVWETNRNRRNQYEEELSAWEETVNRIERRRKRERRNVERLREEYRKGERSGVEAVIEEILRRSPLGRGEWAVTPMFEPKEVGYDPDGQRAMVSVWMPSPGDMPDKKAFSYVKSRDAFKWKTFSKKDFKKLYESTIYRGVLRRMYEVFDGDEMEAIQSIVLNGYVESVNEATGHDETKCTVSIEAQREDIMGLNLSRVDAKACFQDLHGVSASSLEEVSPVTPVAQIDREDGRFTEGRAVGENMEEGQNIAAMDWEEFEHLIRELFAKEFGEDGGEVNVTQSSRDGGIDAVIYDPDPLRGGKLVVQAKRYTRTVGVSAVRDLYGTVMNEGANKGILVTTSSFGPDAYEFASEKPLQLLSGGNLLSLLEKHDYEARINIEEARENGS